MQYPVEVILFDMGNVLIRFSHERMHRQLARVLGSSPERVLEALALDRLQWRYECGLVSTDDVIAALTALATRPDTTPSGILDALCDIFDPIEAMGPVTRALKAQGYRLVLVSNTNEAHLEHIMRRYAVLAPFDSLVLSYEIKAMKPDLSFYRAAVEAAGCEARACIFVDDLVENVEGAARFGLQAILFTTPERLQDDLASRGVLKGA